MANNIGVGALGYVAFGKESTEGTFVTPDKFLSATNVSFDDSNDYLSPMTIRGSRDMVHALPAPFIVNGSLELPLVSEDLELVLQSAFAASVVTTGGANSSYSHVFTPGNASPTMTFETYAAGADGGATGALQMQYSGVRVNTLELRASYGEIVTASVGLDGVDRQRITPVAALTPSYAAVSVNPFHFNGAKVSIGGSDSAVVRDVTLSVNNNVEHIGTLRQTRAYSRVALGAREITMSMSMDFQDGTEYDRLLNDSEFAVTLTFRGPLIGGSTYHSLVVALPRVKYRTVGVPLSAGDFISQDVECTVLKPVSGDIATVTLVNTKTAAAAGLA